MKWNIGTKIGAGYAVALAALLVISIVSYRSIGHLMETAALVTHAHEVLDANEAVLSSLQEVKLRQRVYMITGDEKSLAAFNSGIAAVEKELQKLRELINDPNQLRRLGEVQKLSGEMIAYAQKGVEFTKTNSIGRVAEFNHLHGQETVDKFGIMKEEMDRAELDLLKKRESAAQQSVSKTKTAIVASAGLSLVIFIFLVVLLTRNISSPLKELTDIAERISTGDISGNLAKGTRGDEIGSLIQTFSNMVQYLKEMTSISVRIAGGDLAIAFQPKSDNDQLGNAVSLLLKNNNGLIREIREGINVLASSSSEMLAMSTQLATSTTETATAISETTTTMEEVKNTSRQMSQRAAVVSETAQGTAETSAAGRKAVEDTIAGMGRIREQMDFIASSIVKLSEQSQTIGTIISSVNDLASQSNLLAVNASIEAAKAGEQGKGFAVVAQEVRSLAEQSKEATNQVRTILNDIQKAISGAVMATEQGAKAVETGQNQSEAAGDSIGRIAADIVKSAQAALQISASTNEQVAGIEQVSSAMENIKKAAEQTVASIRQSEESSKNLHELGVKLKQMVARYKV